MKRICNLQTIYAHGPTIYEKNQILLNPSSNCKVVKVKLIGFVLSVVQEYLKVILVIL